MSGSNSNPPLPVPISQATPIGFAGDLLIPVARPGDNTPYVLPGSALPGYSDSPDITIATFTLTAAQLLATFTSPVMLIPAPGIGMAYAFIWTFYDVLVGNTPYVAADGGPQIFYATAVGRAFDALSLGSLFAATANSVTQGIQATSSPVPRAAIENQPLVLASPSVNMTGGNGIATITIAYSVVTLTP